MKPGPDAAELTMAVLAAESEARQDLREQRQRSGAKEPGLAAPTPGGAPGPSSSQAPGSPPEPAPGLTLPPSA